MTKFTSALSAVVLSIVAVSAGQSAAFATEAAIAAGSAAPSVQIGKMVYAAGGKRLASVYSLKADGSPQIILDGKLVTIPASSIDTASGKVTTSLSKAELTR
jgi:hypothetical protein